MTFSSSGVRSCSVVVYIVDNDEQDHLVNRREETDDENDAEQTYLHRYSDETDPYMSLQVCISRIPCSIWSEALPRDGIIPPRSFLLHARTRSSKKPAEHKTFSTFAVELLFRSAQMCPIFVVSVGSHGLLGGDVGASFLLHGDPC